MKAALRKLRPGAQEAPPGMGSHHLGNLRGFDGSHWLLETRERGVVPARTTVAADASAMQAAAQEGRQALYVWSDDPAEAPIIIGLLAPAPVQLEPNARVSEVLVDGKRVVLEASDEIVLRCGAASITLRRNGRLVIRGSYVETRSRGVNRVKGGSVLIN